MMNDTLNKINPYVISCTYLNKENCPPRGTVYQKRRVKWYELELILWGEGHVVTEGTKLPACGGTLFARTPGMVVQGCSPYYCYLVAFDLFYNANKEEQYVERNFLNAISHHDGFGKTAPVPDLFGVHSTQLEPAGLTKMCELFSSIYHCYVTEGVSNQFYLKTLLMQILIQTHMAQKSISVLSNATRSVRQNYSKIIELKKYIDRNIHKRLSVNDLAEAAGLSPNFLCNIFKKITGETIIQYINNSKIALAKRTLASSDKSIKEISADLGFENDTYFYTLFKKKAGVSPLEYRYQHRMIVERRE